MMLSVAIVVGILLALTFFFLVWSENRVTNRKLVGSQKRRRFFTRKKDRE